ncbi:MAG: SufD family Fe-S cluster assembly protein [Muribaculaceae bacterium]|nr:SufD family Fe-S cluster assembly protein [Muribaculaceae bacterium]
MIEHMEHMNSLTQYIELYKQNSALVDNGSVDVINSHRAEALEILENSILPPKGAENYEVVDLNKLLAPDFGLNLARIDIDVNDASPFHCGVPNMNSALFFLHNDIYAEASETRKNLPEGIYVGSLKDFCGRFPLIAEKYYAKIADIRNPLVALNSLLVQDGIVVWVKEGVKFEKPIQIVDILENGMPLMALRRILVIAEKNSQVKLLVCDHTQNDAVDFLNLVTTEISVAEGASVDLCEMEESTEKTVRLSSLYLSQDAGSSVSLSGITLYNGVTRNEYYCSFRGEDAKLKLSGMAIEDESRIIDTYSIVEHRFPGCHTDELFKYVADDNSIAAFSGLIKVFKGASKTQAFQSNRNIIGNDGARVFSKPTLEIYDDDVKCSHGSATGQLDEKQIFYMRTRGLSESEARFLLKQAFMADVIDSIAIPDFKMRLHSLVERRFAGDRHNCSSCKASCL